MTAGAATWIQTHTGGTFDLLNPDPAAVRLDDLAHHLAHLCRYTGACRKFYSVAQHSVRVGMLLPRRLKLAGLLHDAAEAYTGDWSSPMKVAVRQAAPGLLEAIHAPIERAIEERFGLRLTADDRAEIKRADHVMLATEKRDLMPEDTRPGWSASAGLSVLPEADPRFGVRMPWSALDAEFIFRDRFYQWGGK
jgi:hypothetical protein